MCYGEHICEYFNKDLMDKSIGQSAQIAEAHDRRASGTLDEPEAQILRLTSTR